VGTEIGVGLRKRSFGGRGVDHELEALFRRRELGDVMLGMGSTYVFLHGAISLFLLIQLACYYIDRCKSTSTELQEGNSRHSRVEALTPRQRLRQLEPS
jgi:hypothetical protein